eukprot:c21146_g1_i2 orf=382-741(+)
MAQVTEITGPASVTVTISEATASHAPRQDVVTLRLAPRRRKKVTWQAGTIDNEFMQKKSSKKCCIFHKMKSFDEDTSDEEDEGKGKRKIPPCCNGQPADAKESYASSSDSKPGYGGDEQ